MKKWAISFSLLLMKLDIFWGSVKVLIMPLASYPTILDLYSKKYIVIVFSFCLQNFLQSLKSLLLLQDFPLSGLVKCKYLRLSSSKLDSLYYPPFTVLEVVPSTFATTPNFQL